MISKTYIKLISKTLAPDPSPDFQRIFYQCLQLLVATPQPNNQHTRASELNISLCTTTTVTR